MSTSIARARALRRAIPLLSAIALFLFTLIAPVASTTALAADEPSLFCILTGCDGQPGVGFRGGVDPADDAAGLFKAVDSKLELELVAEFAGYAPQNQLGIYNTDGVKIVLFKGEDFASSALTLTFLGDDLLLGEELLAEDFGRTFGFYLENPFVEEAFSWFSEKERNSDGLIDHFQVLPAGKRSYFLGLEDLAGGGDLDYNDFVFQAEGAKLLPPVHAPEPSTSLLLGAGLIGLAAARRNRRR